MDYAFEAREDKINSNLCVSDGNTPVSFHYHDQYELFYLLSGTRTYLRNSNIFYLEEDCITLTKPYIIHATTGGHYSRVCIHFAKEFLLEYFNEQYVERLLEIFSEDMVSNHKIVKNARIKEFFVQIDKYVLEKNYDFAAHALGDLLLDLSVSIKNCEPYVSPTSPKLISTICDYIQNNLAKVKGLADICEEFHFSRSYISHYFKQTTGFTITAYMIEARMTRAMSLLRNTKKSIRRIALECGYDETPYFCLSFKKKMNLTPTDYRKKFNDE